MFIREVVSAVKWSTLVLSCLVFALCCCHVEGTDADDWHNLNLPSTHIPYYFRNRPDLQKLCQNDDSCPYKDITNEKLCWGWEGNCPFEKSYSKHHIQCPGKSKWPSAQNKNDQINLFFRQGDFGFLQDRLNDFTPICSSHRSEDSHLACSDHLRYCVGNNVFFDFKSLRASENNNKYRDDVIKEGEVGGRCTDKFRKQLLKSRCDHKSPLQSWADELIHFESYDDFRVDKNHCDVIYSKPTILIKLDASVSMFHHFCDFVNLYASQHMNQSFSLDVNIVFWDTGAYGFSDTMFGTTWDAFTTNKPIQLHTLDGKKVCFRDLVLPLLARQRMGFYYNMPVVDGCHGSGFFHAFSEHVLHRLKVPQNGPLKRKIRVTLLSRSTKFRKMLNEDELVGALKTISEFEVNRIDFSHKMPFLEQLKLTYNSDIFIGMHGSGLTHVMFLPDWAGIFEIYHCGDPRCYSDLSRLRGIYHRTWEKPSKVFPEDEGKHPTMGTPHEKFTNYAFDVDEFMRIVLEIADHVRHHPLFVREQEKWLQKKEL